MEACPERLRRDGFRNGRGAENQQIERPEAILEATEDSGCKKMCFIYQPGQKQRTAAVCIKNYSRDSFYITLLV